MKGKSGPFFDRLGDFGGEIATALGARFERNPTWYLGRLITVHPLGGCPMGRTRRRVVDPHGEVFGYPWAHGRRRLGHARPGGAEPSLTIAALADRFADGARPR